MTLVNVQLAANAQIFFANLLSVVAFELFDVSDQIYYTLALDETEAFNNNFESLGYETMQFAVNMGFSFFILVLGPFILLLCTLLMYITRPCTRLSGLFKSFLDGMIFNGIITTID